MLPIVDTPARHGLLPVDSDPDTAPYWQGLADGRLLLPRCRDCGRRWAPPSATCPHCGHHGHDWVEHDGRGRIYSWITVHRALDEAFVADVPYVVAVVVLDDSDGARLIGRVLATTGAEDTGRVPPYVETDLPVQTVAYRVAGAPPDRALPGFLPLRAPSPPDQPEQPEQPEQKGTSR